MFIEPKQEIEEQYKMYVSLVTLFLKKTFSHHFTNQIKHFKMKIQALNSLRESQKLNTT